jgi:hypothetical protein
LGASPDLECFVSALENVQRNGSSPSASACQLIEILCTHPSRTFRLSKGLAALDHHAVILQRVCLRRTGAPLDAIHRGPFSHDWRLGVFILLVVFFLLVIIVVGNSRSSSLGTRGGVLLPMTARRPQSTD